MLIVTIFSASGFKGKILNGLAFLSAIHYSNTTKTTHVRKERAQVMKNGLFTTMWSERELLVVICNHLKSRSAFDKKIGCVLEWHSV